MCRTIPGRGQTESEKAWSIGRWASNSHRFISPGGQLAGGQQNRGARAHARTQRTRATPESLHETVTSLRFGSRATRSMVPREVWVFSRHWPRPREWEKGAASAALALPHPTSPQALLLRCYSGFVREQLPCGGPMPRHCQVWLAGWLALGWPSLHPPRRRACSTSPQPPIGALGSWPARYLRVPTYLPAFDALPVSTHKRLWFRLSCIAGTRTNTGPVRCWFCRVSPSCHK